MSTSSVNENGFHLIYFNQHPTHAGGFGVFKTTLLTMRTNPAPHPTNPPNPAQAGPDAMGLDEWPLHLAAEVTGFATPDTDDQANTLLRLLEVGFLPGERVRLTACGLPGRDPLAVRVGQSTFALRRHEAALIRVSALHATSAATTGVAP